MRRDGRLASGYATLGSLRVSIGVSLIIRHKFKLGITPKIWNMLVVLESRDDQSASILDSKADGWATSRSQLYNVDS